MTMGFMMVDTNVGNWWLDSGAVDTSRGSKQALLIYKTTKLGNKALTWGMRSSAMS